MQDGIVQAVETYLREPIAVSIEDIDRKVFAFEFSLMRKVVPVTRLAEDVKRLSSDLLSSYVGRLPPHELSSAVLMLLSQIIVEAEGQYTLDRTNGVNRQISFETSMLQIKELVKAVQSGNVIENPFYSRLTGYLSELSENVAYPS